MRVPKLCIHKPSNRFYVRLNGDFHYLGPVGGPEDRKAAEIEYARLIQEWIAQGCIATPNRAAKTNVNILCAAYLRHAKTVLSDYEQKSTREAFRPLCHWYGSLVAGEFSAGQLEQLRERMAQGGWLSGKAKEAAERRGQGKGWSRKEINRAVGRIRRAFRWGVREGLVPATTWAELTSVENLRRGRRHQARELPPVLPADETAIAAVLAGPLTPPMLADMIRLQLATGMRPGELVKLRWTDVDQDGSIVRRLTGRALDLAGCWVYLPGLRTEGGRLVQNHKTAHHGHHRLVPLSPEARQILERYADVPADEPIFSPRETKRQYYALLRARRKSKVQPSQECRQLACCRKPNPAFDTGSYSQAVRKAIARVNALRAAQEPPPPPIAHFHIGQLRHNAATRLVEAFGWDVARMVLGHSTVSTTRIYAADNLSRVFAALGGS